MSNTTAELPKMKSTWVDDINDRVLNVPQRRVGRGGLLAAEAVLAAEA